MIKVDKKVINVTKTANHPHLKVLSQISYYQSYCSTSMCTQIIMAASNKLRWFFVVLSFDITLDNDDTSETSFSPIVPFGSAAPHKCCSFLPFACSLLSFTIMMGVDRHVFSFNYTQSDTRIVWDPTTGCMPLYSSLS